MRVEVMGVDLDDDADSGVSPSLKASQKCPPRTFEGDKTVDGLMSMARSCPARSAAGGGSVGATANGL